MKQNKKGNIRSSAAVRDSRSPAGAGKKKEISDLPRTKKAAGWIIAIIALVLYINSSWNEFALDDFPTIYGNHLTMKGISAIPTMMKTAYWYGVDEKNDFLYRPLSMVTFALEWEFFPNNPHPGHITNVVLYALTGFLLFHFLARVFKEYNLVFPFAVTLLFIVHPLHTEVVANIKSRDEILCFLFFVLAGDLLFRQVENPKGYLLPLASLCYFLSLLAKESAITFVVILPMMLYYFTGLSWKKILTYAVPFGVTAGIFLIIRGSILTSQTIAGEIVILDNTLVGATGMASRLATAMYIMGWYLKLMLFPYPLSSDYSYPEVPIVGFSNLFALTATIIYGAAFVYAIIRFPRRHIVSFGILFFLIQMALVSNIFFLIRSTMAERFLYIPLLGFCIVAVWGMMKLLKIPAMQQVYSGVGSMFRKNGKLVTVLVILMIPYSIKVIGRNKEWKNDYTLFSGDILKAPNSSRLHFMYADDLYQKVVANKVPEDQKASYLQRAMDELKISHQLHPHYFETNYLMGIIHGIFKQYPDAIAAYKDALVDHPADARVWNNLGLIYNDLGRYDEASETLQTLVRLHPDEELGYVGLAAVWFAQGKYRDAMGLLNKALTINPAYVTAVKNIGDCYGMMKQYDSANVWFEKAIRLDPDNPEYYNRMAITYQYQGDSLNAKKYFAKEQEKKDKIQH